MKFWTTDEYHLEYSISMAEILKERVSYDDCKNITPKYAQRLFDTVLQTLDMYKRPELTETYSPVIEGCLHFYS